MQQINEAQTAGRARWAVAGIFLINGFMIGSWAPHIPLLLTRLTITESTLGLLILCFGIGALISMPWCGFLMSRFGQTQVLRIFGLMQGIGLLLVTLSPNVPVTACAMVIFGSLVGCTDVAMNAATVTVERRLLRSVMSSMHGFWSLGGFVGGGLGGFTLLSFGAVWHGAMVAIVGVGVGIAAAPFLLRDDAREPRAATGEARRSSLPGSPTVYLLGLMALMLFASEGAVLDWAALYMQQERGADVATAGLAYAFFAGAMAVMRFVGDKVRDRFGAVPTLRISSMVAAIAMLAAAFAPTPFLVILAFAVCGLAVANTVPIVFSAAGNYPGVASGTSMSIVTTMGYSGILAAPSLIGFVAEHTGFVPVFSGFAVLLAVVFLMSGLAYTADVKDAAASQS